MRLFSSRVFNIFLHAIELSGNIENAKRKHRIQKSVLAIRSSIVWNETADNGSIELYTVATNSGFY